MVLAEKGLSFESKLVDLIAGEQHDPEYVKLNPNHVVPTLVHDGRVLIESTFINEYLDDAFPDPALRPSDAADRHTMRMWTKRIDSDVHPNAGVITFGIGTRPLLLAQGAEAIEASIAAMPSAAKRAQRKSVIENGVKAPEMKPAIHAFVAMLDDMESALESSPWLAGGEFSLADACAMPYVLRLDHLSMTPFLSADKRPRVADWWARVQARPAYEVAVSSQVPDFIVDMLRGNGAEVWSDVEAFATS